MKSQFQFFNLPLERGEILFSKGFFYSYGYSQTTRQRRNERLMGQLLGMVDIVEPLSTTGLSITQHKT